LPLASERKAKFTATEVSWMSLDVSPDGQTIVFDLLGDLYTLPIGGGTATRITQGMAYDAQPRFSPDGETLVFVSDRSGGDNVWTLRLDFTDTTQVTRGNTSLYVSPEWMPDGEYIVVSRSTSLFGAHKLMMYHKNGGSPISLVRTPAPFKTLGASPTPDGDYVWYAGRFNDWQYNAFLPQYQLYRYDRERGTSSRMTSRYGSAFRPAVSPDGQWLVYGTRSETQTGLRRRNLATGDERWLAYPVQRDEQESRATIDVLPGWRQDLECPDGRKHTDGDCLRGGRRSRRRTQGGLRVRCGHGSVGDGAADPPPGGLARRQPDGLHGVRPAVGQGHALWGGPAADRFGNG
jgi:Tol biopolymer transport system component